MFVDRLVLIPAVCCRPLSIERNLYQVYINFCPNSSLNKKCCQNDKPRVEREPLDK